MTEDYRFTPAVQRAFLEVLAETGSATQAAAAVKKSRTAAYALRQRVEGEAFRLGWYGAMLIARDILVDDLMERAIYGQTDVIDRDPETGRRVRTRKDNRLGQAMLTRLDHQLDASPFTPGINAPAWRVSQRWGEWLDLVENGGHATDIMAFLKRGPGGEMFESDEDDIFPSRARGAEGVAEQQRLGVGASSSSKRDTDPPPAPPASGRGVDTHGQCQLGASGSSPARGSRRRCAATAGPFAQTNGGGGLPDQSPVPERPTPLAQPVAATAPQAGRIEGDEQCQLGGDQPQIYEQRYAALFAEQPPGYLDGQWEYDTFDDGLTLEQRKAFVMGHVQRWQTDSGEWRTNFGKPFNYYGDEEGSFGEDGYSRSMMWDEVQAMRQEEEDARAKAAATDTNGQCQLGPDTEVKAKATPRRLNRRQRRKAAAKAQASVRQNTATNMRNG